MPKKTMSKREREAAQVEAIARLRTILKPGMRVRCIDRDPRNRSSKHYTSLVIVDPRDNEVWCMDWIVARALDRTVDERIGGIVSHGHGTSPSGELVYELGLALWPDGFVDGNNRHTSGGYALKYDSL